jgi:hypothetical protein
MLAASAIRTFVEMRPAAEVWEGDDATDAVTQRLNRVRESWESARAAVLPLQLLFGRDSPVSAHALQALGWLRDMTVVIQRHHMNFHFLGREQVEADPVAAVIKCYSEAKAEVESFLDAANAEIRGGKQRLGARQRAALWPEHDPND